MPDLAVLLFDIFDAVVSAAVWLVGAFIFIFVVGIIADAIDKYKRFP